MISTEQQDAEKKCENTGQKLGWKIAQSSSGMHMRFTWISLSGYGILFEKENNSISFKRHMQISNFQCH